MMDWTDRHLRSLLRLYGPEIVLYTEMVTARALIHGDPRQLLAFSTDEHPLALQLGGSEPDELARAARLGAEAGYDEINLNVGCPSERVRSGAFGACLMAEPALVADSVRAMAEAVDLPVTVKCRLGIDDLDDDGHLDRFIDTVADAGCGLFIVHARKAILGGLTPKQNREIPPLQYARVHRQAQRRPDLEILINGGITDAGTAAREATLTSGVMIGRAAYHSPHVLGAMRKRLFGLDQAAPDDADIVRAYLPYIRAELANGTPLQHIGRHMLGLFQGRPGARAWRRRISEQGRQPGAGIEVVERALREMVPEASLVA